MTDALSTAVSRVPGSERIAALDVLRGVAILGILLLNIAVMGGYHTVQPADPRLVSWTTADEAVVRALFFLDGTQRGILELLFGAGIMILSRAARSPEGPVAVADLHFRRNLWLIAFGLAHAFVLLWPGDILFTYGIAAIFAFPFRRLAPSRKAALGVMLALLAVAPGLLGYQSRVKLQADVVAAQAKRDAGQVVSAGERAKIDKWKARVAARAPLAQNPEKQAALVEEKTARLGPLPGYYAFLTGIWIELNVTYVYIVLAEVVGTMLIGMALYDWGVVQGGRRARFYLAMAAVGYGVCGPLAWAAAADYVSFSPAPKPAALFGAFVRLGLTLAHISLILLLLRSRAGAWALSMFQAAGRMPLTIYLGQSVIGMIILFPGVGLGLFGRFGWAGLEAIALAIIAGQLVFANLWMRVFETGPVDWLWKSLAYGKPQPFRKVVGAPAARDMAGA